MEIVVESKSKKFISPNEITLHLEFITKEVSYEEVLEKGIQNIQSFIDLLIENKFQKEDIKTKNFVIREEKKYNEVTRIYEKDGFSFHQQATLRFDYDKDVIANLMVNLSKLENAPVCQLSFGIKEERRIRQSILKEAYQDALEQATAIALVAGKTLKDCKKVDFKPFASSYHSLSTLDGIMARKAEAKMLGAAEMISNIFTPEDIELIETLHCLWLAE